MFQTVFPIGFSYFSACLPPSNLLLNSKTFCFDTAYSSPSEAQVALAQDEKGAAAELHLAQLRAASLFWCGYTVEHACTTTTIW